MELDFYAFCTVLCCPEDLISKFQTFVLKICLCFCLHRLKTDMQDHDGNSLVDPMGECTQALLNLIVFGMATPYLHNGVMEIEDEEKQEVNKSKQK